MRNITQGTNHHNCRLPAAAPPQQTARLWTSRDRVATSLPLARMAFLSLFCLASSLLLGCQGESQPPATSSSSGQTAASDQGPLTREGEASCPVVVQRRAQEAFMGLGERLTEGKRVALEDFQALCEQEDYARWLKTYNLGYVNGSIMRNVMTYVFADSTTAPDGTWRKPKRKELTQNFTYVKEHTAEVAEFLARFEAEDWHCRVRDHLEGFIDLSLLPQPLTISFLTLLPEIRYLEDHLLVDAGLAVAGSPEQLSRLIASVVYRVLAAPGGRAPHENLPGAEALVATYRKLLLEGISGWLEGYPDLDFDNDHPLLGEPDLMRQEYLTRAAEALASMHRYLAIVMASEEKLHLQGGLVDDVLRGLGAYTLTGYAMAELIATQLGEQQLAASSRSTRAFLEAYQKAAVLAKEDPGESSATRPVLPPFPQKEFQALLELLP